MTTRKWLYAVLALTTSAFMIVGCSRAASAPATPPAPPTTTPTAPTAVPTKPAAPTAVPTKPAEPTKPATTQAVAQPTATATVKPADSVSVADLTARAKANRDYCAELKGLVSSVELIAAKYFCKGAKIRIDINVMGLEVVSLIDLDANSALTWDPEGKEGTKSAAAEIVNRLMVPRELVANLPTDAKVTGTETVDGKPAAVVEMAGTTDRYWIWTDKGLPLKGEVTAHDTKTSLVFTNYKFEAQPDSLFQQPTDLEITDETGTSSGQTGDLAAQGVGLTLPDLADRAKAKAEAVDHEYTLEFQGTVTPAQTSKPMGFTGEVVVKGTKLRTDMVMNRADNQVVLGDITTKQAISYVEGQSTAKKEGLAKALGPIAIPHTLVSSLPLDAKITGRETLDESCDMAVVVEVPSTRSKWWIDPQTGFPLKQESVTEQGRWVVEYPTFFDISLPDGYFELPGDVHVQ